MGWKTLGISMTIAMFVVLVFGMIAGIVAIDQSHELDLAKGTAAGSKTVTAQKKFNAEWRRDRIATQKQLEQTDMKKKYTADDKPEDGVNHKAEAVHDLKQIKADIECFDDDSSIAYRVERCKLKKSIADKKFVLANTKATKTYKDISEDKLKAEHTKDQDLALKVDEAHLEFLESL